MCGWSAFVVSSTHSFSPSVPSALLRERGPDAFNEIDDFGGFQLRAAVLHLRGRVPQPVLSADGLSALLWNGEEYGGPFEANSDTLAVLRRLENNNDDKATTSAILETLEGPFAMAFADSKRMRLLFARDRGGRRSLVMRRGAAEQVIEVASVCGDEGEWEEVPPAGVFALDAATGALTLLEPYSQRPAAPSPPADTSVEAFLRLLSEAVRKRVLCAPAPREKEDARVAVLFSGGVDCAVLAALCDAHLPRGEPIDLLNVAFRGERRLSGAALASVVPDRATALNSAAELSTAFPQRTFRLVNVDVSLEDLEREHAHIRALVAPKGSVMDFNIAALLFFAATGRGSTRSGSGVRHRRWPLCRYYGDDDEEDDSKGREGEENDWADDCKEFRTAARVVLIGIGADEQLGGYGRHRKAFAQGGVDAVRSELSRDVSRLWERNLGRDDRAVAATGREARHPFLDEAVVAFAAGAPVDALCDLSQPQGLGDKRILREAARLLGLDRAARLLKRAIQFGTRLADSRVPGERAMADDAGGLRQQVNRQACNAIK